jgi:hypothetical protein
MKQQFMKRILLPTLLLLSVVGFAQPKFKSFPDSIRVELPEAGALVVFELKEFSKSDSVILTFPRMLQTILENVRKAEPGIMGTEPMNIEVRTGPEGTKEVGLGVKPFGERQEITIRPAAEKRTTMTLLKDRGVVELLPPGWEITFHSREYRVWIYGSTLAALDSVARQNFEVVTNTVQNDPGRKGRSKRSSIESRMIIRGHQLESSSIKYVFPGDLIGLGIQGGIGVVQNIVYPELSAKLALTFRDRSRRPKTRSSLILNQMYFTEQTAEGFTLQPNTFLSGAFEVNFNKKSGNASWSGLGIGYLLKGEGNYFQGNTWKFFITHTIPGSRFSMVPEFYLTDNFKKFTFGMTLKYAF